MSLASKKRYSLMQIKTAVLSSVCMEAGNIKKLVEDEASKHKFWRASTSHEDDIQLAVVLFIGVARANGHRLYDIQMIAGSSNDEVRFKLSKYSERIKENDKRFINKIKLINNYLKINYGSI